MGVCSSSRTSAAALAGAEAFCCEEGAAVVGSSYDLSLLPNRSKSFRGDEEAAVAGDVGFACRKGIQMKGSYPNQDSWFVVRRDRVTVCAVLDGHGEKGHVVSNRAKEVFTEHLAEDARLGTSDCAACLRASFQNAQAKVRCWKGAVMSGTTATLAVIDAARGRITVCHVGDSSAILGRCRSLKRGTSNVYEGLQLTREHKPDFEDEAKRVLAAGAELWNDRHCTRIVRPGTHCPGLNMSRSLGDNYGHTFCGMIAIPEVTEMDIGPDDQVLLLCSDGVWDVFEPEEAVAFVLATREQVEKPRAVAEALVAEARKRYLQGAGGKRCDDITAVVVYLDDCNSSDMLDDSTAVGSTSEEEGCAYDADMALRSTQRPTQGVRAIRTDGFRTLHTQSVKSVQKLRSEALLRVFQH